MKMNKCFLLVSLVFLFNKGFSQYLSKYEWEFPAVNVIHSNLVEVQTAYDKSSGDTFFSAHNKSKVPLYLHVYFPEVSRMSFREKQPYVKKLNPGYNGLFRLEKSRYRRIPKYYFEIKSFRSNPIAEVNLEFPYLLPFEPGKKIKTKKLNSADGLWVLEEPEPWASIGFYANPGDKIYASRRGVIVEIAPGKRYKDSIHWYNSWNNAVTLLHPDGTLCCYANVVVKNKKLKLNKEVFAGELLGEMATSASELEIFVYHNKLFSDKLHFIIPKFVTGENSAKILEDEKEYMVVHPRSVRILEMTKLENRRVK